MATSQQLPKATSAVDNGKPSSSGRDIASFSSAAGAAAEIPTPQLNFNDYSAVFGQRSTAALLRSYLVLAACGIRPLVTHANGLINLGRSVMGDRITLGAIKHTFFSHFCAGESELELGPTMELLRRNGIGAILDFAAEDDVQPAAVQRDGASGGGGNSGTAAPAPAAAGVVARTYDYASEQMCDHHVGIFLNAIDTVGRLPGRGFAAIKATALGNPKLLERMSVALTEIRDLFRQADTDGSGFVDVAEFQSMYGSLFPHAPPEEANRLFAAFDKQGSGKVDYISWCQALQLAEMPRIAERLKKRGTFHAVQRDFVRRALEEGEVQLVGAMMGRVRQLADAAARQNVALMVDAEHTYFQPAIDHTVKELMRTYNTGDRPIIFNTYQCYLKDSRERLLGDIARAQREGYRFACKLVRGAYLQLERARATKEGYPSPVWDTLQQTHDNYNACLELVLREVKHSGAELMVASHNQASVESAVRLMTQLGIDPADGGVYFGQLLGMADNLTYQLGQHGYKAFKYVPYGPVQQVMPYLIRRAQENSSIMGQGVKKELAVLRRELWRRATAKLPLPGRQAQEQRAAAAGTQPGRPGGSSGDVKPRQPHASAH